MSEKNQSAPEGDTPDTANVGQAIGAGGVSRRKLVRAGLAAAPVMAALKSNTVLAGDHTCVKPSSFSSLNPNWVVSRGRSVDTNYECHSHGYWKKNDRPHPAPYNVKAKSYFLAVPQGATSGSISAGFSGESSSRFYGMTLSQVLDDGGNDENTALARHLVAFFLTAVANGDDGNRVLLTTAQCKAIWTGGGVWSPVPGLDWKYDDTKAYFDKVLGKPFRIEQL